MSANPYASGEAALPVTEVVPRAPKVAMASAVLALTSVAGIVGAIAYISWTFTDGTPATPGETDIAAFIVVGSIVVAVVGMLLGIGALFVRRHSRVVASIATFINGAIVLSSATLLGYSIYASSRSP